MYGFEPDNMDLPESFAERSEDGEGNWKKSRKEFHEEFENLLLMFREHDALYMLYFAQIILRLLRKVMMRKL